MEDNENMKKKNMKKMRNKSLNKMENKSKQNGK